MKKLTGWKGSLESERDTTIALKSFVDGSWGFLGKVGVDDMSETMEELKLALCFLVIDIAIFLPRNLKLLRFIIENEGREGFGGMNLVWFWETESVSENVWSYRDGFWIYNRRALRVWSIYGYVPLHPNYKVSSFIVNFNYHSQWVMVLQFEFNIYVIIKTKIMLVIFNHLTMWGVVKQ